MNLKATLNTRVDTLRKSEKLTKVELGLASREILDYLLNDNCPHDVGMLNRLADALTPMNRKVLVLFAKHFLPYRYNEDMGLFGKLNKKKLANCEELVKEFLETEENIWDWADRAVDIKPAPVDYGKRIKNNITKALKGDVEKGQAPMSQADILACVLDAGIEIDEVINLLSSQEDIEVTEVTEAA